MYTNQYEAIVNFTFDHFQKAPLLVVGTTGVGKTDIPEGIYRKKLNVYEMALRALEADSTNVGAKNEVAKGAVGWAYLNFTACEYGDLVGMPMIQNGQMIYASPKAFKEMEKFPRGIMVLDEVNRVELQTRQAYMQMLDRRAIGDIKIPPGWVIVQTANPADDNYQVSDFDKALVRRSSYMELVFDIATWQAFGLTEYVSPYGGGHMNPRVMSLATRLTAKGLVQKIDNQIKATPTAAGLTLVGEMLDAGVDKYLERACREILIAGLIGAGAATMLESAMKDDRLKGLLDAALKAQPIKGEQQAIMVDLMFLFYDVASKEPKKYAEAFHVLWKSLPEDSMPVLAKSCYPFFQKYKDAFAPFKKDWSAWCLKNMMMMKGIELDDDTKEQTGGK